MKLRRLLASTLAVAISLAFLQVVSPDAAASTGDRYGPVTHYNGFIFGNFTSAQADIEGALAVGGDVAMGTFLNQYDVGAAINSRAGSQVIGHYNNDSGYPSLLISGHDNYTIKLGTRSGGYFNIYGGRVVMSERLLNGSYNSSGNPNRFSIASVEPTDTDEVKDYFEDAKVRAAKVSAILGDNAHDYKVPLSNFAGYWGTPVAPSAIFNDLSNFEIKFTNAFPEFTNKTTQTVLVVNVTGTNALINEVTLNSSMLDYDFILFNFPEATTVAFTGGAILLKGKGIINTSSKIGTGDNQIIADFASRIVWNFPKATQVGVSAYGVIGSVLAPSAHVEGNGGSINGMLIADSFTTTNGMELHAFSFPELPGEELDDEDDNQNTGDPHDPGWGPLPVPQGSVKLHKVDDTGRPIYVDDIEFTLHVYTDATRTTELEPPRTFRTDRAGQIEIENLPWGFYSLKEVGAPPGYIRNDQSLDFYIGPDNYHTQLELRFINKPHRFAVAARKRTEEGGVPGDPLGGAVFRLYRVDSVGKLHFIGDYTSDSDGLILPNSVFIYDAVSAPFGTYRVYEIATAPGYKVTSIDAYMDIVIGYDESIQKVVYKLLDQHGVEITDPALREYITLDINGTSYDVLGPVILNGEDTGDDAARDLVLFKRDRTGLALEGAAFELFKYDDPLRSGVEADVPAVSDKAADETPPPNGDGTAGEDDELPDGEDGEENSPADSDEAGTDEGDEGSSETADEAGEASDGGLAPLGAIVRPAGVTRTLGAMASPQGDPNPPDAGEPGDGDEDGEAAKEAGETSAAAADTPPTARAGGMTSLGIGHTKEQGILFMEDVEPGRYHVKEVTPPSGYRNIGLYFDFVVPTDPLADPQVIVPPEFEDYIEFIYYGEAFGVTVFNEANADGEIIIKKVDGTTADADGNPIGSTPVKTLAGATFKLYYVDDGDLYYVDTGTTDAQGEIHFTGLPLGHYLLEEAEAPDGYTLPWGVVYLINLTDSHKIDRQVIRNDPTIGSAAFRKVDKDDTGKGLAGAEFDVYKLSLGDDLTYRWEHHSGTYRSGSDGMIHIDGLDTATIYKLQEVRTPDGYGGNEGSDSSTLFMADGNLYDAPYSVVITNTRVTTTRPPPTDSGGGDGDPPPDVVIPPPDVTTPPTNPNEEDFTPEGDLPRPQPDLTLILDDNVSLEDLPQTGVMSVEAAVPLALAVGLSTVAVRRWRRRRRATHR